MESNYYEAPKTEPKIEEKKGSAIKALLVGFAIDAIGTFTIGFVAGIVFFAIRMSGGATPEMVLQDLAVIKPTSTFFVMLAILGLLVSVLAGYVCARIVNYKEYMYSTILAILSVVFSTVMHPRSYSTGLLVFLGFLTLLAFYLGTWLHIRKKKTV